MRKAVVILALLPFLFCACSSKTAKKGDTPGAAYVEGVELMQKKKYDQAIERFSYVRDNFPFDPIADVATVKLADTYYEKKEYLFASGVYTDYVNAHPDDENVPYVLWRLGKCLEELSLTIDRDQTYTLKAIERLTYLKNRYPTSQYAAQADESVAKLTQKLVDRELYVGEFYCRTFQYNACAIRLEYMLSKYPDAKGIDKALYLLTEAYRQLNNPDKVLFYTQKLLQEHANSPHAKTQVKGRTASTVPGQKQPVSQASTTLTWSTTGKPAADEKTLALAKPGKEPLSLPLTEERKSPRRIALRPPDPATTTPAEEQGGQAPGEQAAKQDTKPDAAQETKQEAKGSDQKEAPAKSSDKDKAFGFFKAKQPVDVVADMMEGLEKGKVIMFKGNVVAKQEDLQIFSDTLTAYLNEENDEIDRALAKGNVKIIKAERIATCEEALFENAKGQITLKGNVVVYSGADRLAGDTIVYYINDDRVVVEGEKEKRARITLHPK
jgi:outer membrane protein assembly factor BamD